MRSESQLLQRRRLGSSQILVSRSATFPAVAAAALAEELADPTGSQLFLALSGGSTPGPVYESLARAGNVDWARVDIYFADERAVPPEDEASNYHLIRRTLLDLLPADPRAVHRMEADRPELAEAAARYDRSLPDAIDLLVLGIGGDGHTASLFPGSRNLEETTRRVAVAESPVPPRGRLTITPVVIRAARQICVLASGSEKARPVAQALLGDPDVSACPAQLARGGKWVLDEEAAALLD
jgi:6-phosphogluconolactonase